MQVERIRIRGSRSEGKGYVAEITGIDGRYGFERDFLRAVEHDGDEAEFAVEPGKVYEVRASGTDKQYWVYDGSGSESLEASEVREHLEGKPLAELLVLIAV